jgi:hypothetical protein
MLRRQGHVPTTEASRYLQRLCYHFTRKITVHYDTHRGEARFPWGLCVLHADDAALHFDCTAADAELLARVQFAIDAHVELFSRKNPVPVLWQPVQTGAALEANTVEPMPAPTAMRQP